MRIQFECTVEKLPEELAKTGARGDQVVIATVLDEEDAAKLEALRADVQLGLDDLDAGRVGPLDVDGFVTELRERR